MRVPDTHHARDLVRSARALFLDLDGTLYRGDRVLPQAVDWVHSLRQCGQQVYFLSNNTSRGTQAYLHKLGQMGLCHDSNEIWGALNATLLHLQQLGLRELLVLGCDDVLTEFRQAGFQLVERNPQAVVLAYDTTLDYAKICLAHRALESGAAFFATHPDLLCPTEDGFVPDVGSFLALFQAAGHGPATVVGKPHATMLRPLMERLDLRPSECLVVGDRLYTDIRMAIESGLPSLLTLTGESQLLDLAHSPWQPDAIVSSVADLLEP